MTFQQIKSSKSIKIEAVNTSLTDHFGEGYLSPIDTPSIVLGNYNFHPTYISYDRKELLQE